MPTHDYGDEDFDWAGLDKAITYINNNLIKWGRVNVRQAKEKWGTARIYCSLGWSSLLSITHPNYCHYRPYPKWLMRLDIFYLSKVIPGLFNWWVLPYHKWLYVKLYSDMVKKYPHLKDEITSCCDYPALLKDL